MLKSTFKGFAPKDAAWKTEFFCIRYLLKTKSANQQKQLHKDAFHVKTSQSAKNRPKNRCTPFLHKSLELSGLSLQCINEFEMNKNQHKTPEKNLKALLTKSYRKLFLDKERKCAHETYTLLRLCFIEVPVRSYSARGKALGTKVNTNWE